MDELLIDAASFDDPGAFTRPFTVTKRYQRSAPFQEYACQENEHEGGMPTASGEPTQYRLPQTK